MANKAAREKYGILKGNLKALGSVAVAFSGGVDSSLLLYAAHSVLGDNALAVTMSSCTFPSRELEEARGFCEKYGIKQIIRESDELSIPGFSENPVNRCYLCKKGIYGELRSAAGENGITNIAEGSNMDDLGDYRPGLKALEEMAVLSPLKDAGLYKDEIRAIARELGLSVWDKPSSACLASRFAYGETINTKKLNMVEKAEMLLRDLGFRQSRVRIHGDDMARIEVPEEDIPKLAEPYVRSRVYSGLKEEGFAYISLDLGGYRTGSMNEVL